MAQIEQAWAGIDAGNEHHHIVVIDSGGHQLLARRVLNEESELNMAVDDALNRAVDVTWAIDLADGPAALMITLLLERGQRLLFLPGIAVNRASSAYRGEGKTNTKDAAVIADQAACGATHASCISKTTYRRAAHAHGPARRSRG